MASFLAPSGLGIYETDIVDLFMACEPGPDNFGIFHD